MACAAIAGSIRAGCRTESLTYRPRRCTGPVDWAVAQTDSRPGSATAPLPAPALVLVVGVFRPRSSSGSGVPMRVMVLGTGVTASAVPRRGRLGLAEHEAVGVHPQVRDRP